MGCNAVELSYTRPRRGILESDDILAKDNVAQKAVHLLSVGLGDLADELGPSHVYGPVDLAGLRSRIVFSE